MSAATTIAVEKLRSGLDADIRGDRAPSADGCADGRDDANGLSCRFCSSPLTHTFVDLGMSPLCQRHVTPAGLAEMEPFYPLHVRICDKCLLVQLPEVVKPEIIFSDYAYFSSYVDTLLKQADAYAGQMVGQFGIGPSSRVIEIASNDGYLLQYFKQRGVPVLGIEPAANVAEVAVKKGIPTEVAFFGTAIARRIAEEGGPADLLLGNNVLPHVPNLNDFVGGLKLLLAPTGVITVDFQHILTMMQGNQFDTIYHEHFSYLSLTTTRKVFAAHGLTVFDVQRLPTHGGSLRIFARNADDESKPVTANVAAMEAVEAGAGLAKLEGYFGFGEKVKETKRKLLTFLINAKSAGKSIVGYGAPGKSATLLNYCGIRSDFIDYTVDRSPHKQGNFLPGTRIPIHHPDRIKETKPDYVLLLPWNLRDEIKSQTAYIREWGGRWVVPIPAVAILE